MGYFLDRSDSSKDYRKLIEKIELLEVKDTPIEEQEVIRAHKSWVRHPLYTFCSNYY